MEYEYLLQPQFLSCTRYGILSQSHSYSHNDLCKTVSFFSPHPAGNKVNHALVLKLALLKGSALVLIHGGEVIRSKPPFYPQR